eukprot:SAG11_NODE_6288_length_1344_cov_0.857831_2_plen_165_part_00
MIWGLWGWAVIFEPCPHRDCSPPELWGTFAAIAGWVLLVVTSSYMGMYCCRCCLVCSTVFGAILGLVCKLCRPLPLKPIFCLPRPTPKPPRIFFAGKASCKKLLHCASQAESSIASFMLLSDMVGGWLEGLERAVPGAVPNFLERMEERWAVKLALAVVPSRTL